MPYDSYTKLLCHFNGTAGTYNIQDSSIFPKVVTAYNTANTTTDQKKIGNSSIYFDGNSDYLSASDSWDWDFGTGDFTLDTWFKLSDTGGTYCFLNTTAATTNLNWRTHQDNGILLYVGGTQYEFAWTQDTDWHHLAMVRSGNDLYCFLDGSQIGSTQDVTGKNVTSSEYMWIGAQAAVEYCYFPGYIDELRISNTARWTSNFTPETTAYIADDNTKLLLHGESLDVATGKPATFYGTSELASVQPKFGSDCCYFNGINGTSYFTIPDSADLQWGLDTTPYTIDFWIYVPSTFWRNGYPAGYQNGAIFFKSNTSYPSSGEGFEAWISGYSVAGWYLTFVGVTQNSAENVWYFSSEYLTYDAWHHIAITKDASLYWNLYSDGDSSGTTFIYGDPQVTLLTSYPSNGLLTFGTHHAWHGLDVGDALFYLDEFRVSDTVRWSSTFTPPSSEYSDDANTRLLLHFNGNYTDSSSFGKTVTNAGSHIISSKFGATTYSGRGIIFDGNSDYISFPDSADWDFGAGDFTIDLWIRFNALGATERIFGDLDAGGSDYAWFIYKNDADNVTIYVKCTDTSTFAVSCAPISTNTWYHIAAVRSSATLKIYLNGVSQGLPQNLGTKIVQDVVGSICLGRTGNYNGDYFNGYVDEVRVSKGIARWTEDFTPPTTEYAEENSIYNAIFYAMNT